MLSAALLTIAIQAAAEPRNPVVRDVTPPASSGRNLWSVAPRCADHPVRTSAPVAPGRDLAWRSGQEPVRMYLLLDRYAAGCPAPLVVMERVPGSNAIGRELRRPR